MLSILGVVLPVFLIVGTGYSAVRWFGFRDSGIDGLIGYTLRVAIPLLLFRAMLGIDLGRAFDPPLLGAFYLGAFVTYGGTILLAMAVWRRHADEAIAIGFCALFSNTLLLGLPILERAYGDPVMPAAFSIIALHAPVMYLVGISSMELVRGAGSGLGATARRAGRAIFSNAMTIAIAAGLALNLSGLPLPEPVMAAVTLVAASALPAALFGLGGALTRYRLRDDVGVGAMTALMATLLHPAIVWALTGQVLRLDMDAVRAAVVLSAMPTGMNGYMFASMYDRGQGAAASTVLLGTGLSVATASFWLWLLGGTA
jgi:predicted permease